MVRLYVAGDAAVDALVRSLRAVERIHLRSGESHQARFAVASESVPKSKVEIRVSGGQPAGNTPHVRGPL